jgi:IclR family transcriptional regulator, acetate operon repressor
MDQEPTRGVAAIEKGLELFVRVVDDAGQTPLSVLARQAGIPTSTSQRIVAAYVRHGLLSRVDRGRYAAGVRLAGEARVRDLRSVLIAASRPLIRHLAGDLRTTVHLGVLESDMVTYLVKEHGGGPDILTREMIQLEAYCSGIGKVLLAHLPEAEQEAYLATGPFVALTPNTMTDPPALRSAFQIIRRQGYAIDQAEVDENLFCLAAPVCGPDGVLAALSVSLDTPERLNPVVLDQLRTCAARIGRRLGSLRAHDNLPYAPSVGLTT